MGKKKLELLIKSIAFIMALGLFFALLWVMKGYDKGNDTTYKIVCLGDSNFGNYQNETGIVSHLEKKLGEPVLNGGFGGSMLVSVSGRKTEYHSVLSMYNLAISICNDNFGVQKSAIDNIGRTDYIGYYKNTLDKLASVDFDSVETLIIEHGVNDYLVGVPIKNGVDKYDSDTFGGALRCILKMLQEEYPDMRIILVTPPYCAPFGSDYLPRPCEEYNYGGGYLEEYVNEELEIAKEMGVEVIDLYHMIDLDADNFPQYLFDGLHFNEIGREVVADIIADYLLGEAE